MLLANLAAICLIQSYTPVVESPIAKDQTLITEGLTPEQIKSSDEILLKILDGAGLYTLLGLKPITSGFFSARIPTSGSSQQKRETELQNTDEFRRLIPSLTIPGVTSVAAIPYAETFNGERSIEGFIFHRASVSAQVAKNASLFGQWGTTPRSEPTEIIQSFEQDESVQRFRAFGILFGYPKHAIDFFVNAELEKQETATFVARDFFQIPTFSSPTGQFVYAVPTGYVPTAEDLKLLADAENILSYYKSIRDLYIGPDKAGPRQLIRDWFADSHGNMSTGEAIRKVNKLQY